MHIANHHHKTASFCLSLAGILTAAIGVIVFVDNKRHNKLKEEVMVLDKEIKELQLAKEKGLSLD